MFSISLSFTWNEVSRFSIVRLGIELRDTISRESRIHVEEEEGWKSLLFTPFQVEIHCSSGTKGANGSNGWRRHVEESPLFRFRIARKTSPLKNSTKSLSRHRSGSNFGGRRDASTRARSPRIFELGIKVSIIVRLFFPSPFTVTRKLDN